MTAQVLIDGRPAQKRPRGMGIYVIRLVRAMLDLEDTELGGVKIMVALDQALGYDPWQDLAKLKKIRGMAKTTYHWEQKVLPQLAKAHHADLLHTVANSGPVHCPVPVILTIHDVIFMRPLAATVENIRWRTILGHYYYRWFVPRAAKKAKLILTDSMASQKGIQKKLRIGAGKIRVIPLAAPYRAQPIPEAKLEDVLGRLRLSKPYALAFGAIDLRKNIENLIRAFARLPRSAVESLVLLGFEKFSETSIPDLIHLLGVGDRIRILGYLDEDELNAVMQSASVFVYPSKAEGFGLPILHAFHLGVPVVTTKVDSIPEVAGQAVRYADPNEIQSITEEMLAVIINSDEAHRLAVAGYQQSKHFSWNQTAKLTVAAYQSVLN